jgi:hypothetical protein
MQATACTCLSVHELTTMYNCVRVNTIHLGNLHKWCFTPKGSAFLWVSKEQQQHAQGVVISHQLVARLCCPPACFHLPIAQPKLNRSEQVRER